MPTSVSVLGTSPTAAASPDTELQVLLIHVGSRTFGLPLAQVRYVAAMASDFASRGKNVADYFVFEGEALSYVPLWDVLGLDSRYGEYEEMQAMLPQRRQDHLDWMAALEDSLRNGIPFTKARSPRECAFGKWFYGFRSQDRRLSMLLDQFEQPHAVIHSLADRLLGLAEAGRRDEALALFTEEKNSTLANLLLLFKSAQDLVVELQRRIAVIVSDGERSCALGADHVRDIVDIPPDRRRPDVKAGLEGRPRATSGLIILEDQSIVPMLNWQGFTPAAESVA